METLDRNTLINRAGMAGALVGTISAAYIFISILLNNPENKLLTALVSLLDIAKTVGIIILMIFLMKRFCASYDGVTNRDTKRYGNWIALFSALITAVASFIAYEFAFPDFATTTLDTVYAQMGSMLDDNARNALEKLENNFSTFSAVSTLIWCIIYGLVLTAILSSRIPARDPFKEFKEAEANEEETEEQ